MAERPLVGMGWMVLAGLSFVIFIAAVKLVGEGVPAVQGAFLRFAFGVVFLLPALRGLRSAWPRGQDLRLFLARGAVHSLAVTSWFHAMVRIPIAEVTAMNYLTPVYVTVGAALFLGERLALRRMAAIAVALLGALVLLRPGFRELSDGHLAMLVASLSLGASYVLAKGLSGRFAPSVVVAWLSLVVTVLLLPGALAVWVPLTAAQYAYLALSAVFATAGHYAMTCAFQEAPVAVTQPVTFLQLVWAVLLGTLAFGEAIDPFVVTGGTIIVAAVSFIAWRERQLKSTKKLQT